MGFCWFKGLAKMFSIAISRHDIGHFWQFSLLLLLTSTICRIYEYIFTSLLRNQLKGRMGCTINSSYLVSNAILGKYRSVWMWALGVSANFRSFWKICQFLCLLHHLINIRWGCIFSLKKGNFLSWEMLLVLKVHSYHSFLERERGMN